ncbi:MAG: lysine--tRNA ligase [Cyanobacteria bacterium DS2.3.42]|nr:lysine--tRNA ligase [Cyanobacteria bacterium DS2.3.42]
MTSEQDDSRLRQERLRKLEMMKEQGINPYPYSFTRTHKAEDLHEKYKDLAADTETEDVVRVCGRVLNERNTWMFVDLYDDSGKIQLFCHKQNIPEEELKRLRLLDKGDFLGAEGTIRRTKQGELSVKVTSYEILGKTLQPLPDSWDGFTDVEARYRHRYVDMIMNPNVRETFKKRSIAIRTIREFLDSRGCLEVETPVLQVEAGGADARPFITHHNTLDIDLYLRIATELHLKRLIVGGFERVYEIGRIFRNEGISTRHNPEFTMLELYWAYGDYNQLMDLAEELIVETAMKVCGDSKVTYQGVEIDFKRPFRRLRMVDAIKETTGLDCQTLKTYEDAKAAAQKLGGVDLTHCDTRGHVINAIFEHKAESSLIQPTFLIDYPVEMSPLTKPHRTNPGEVERFELFAYGRELANGYSELTDPLDQRQRLEEQAAKKAAGNEEAMPLDLDFINAMEYGMPPTMGIGIGIDRLVMLLTDSASIRDVVAFPTMKPIVKKSES